MISFAPILLSLLSAPARAPAPPAKAPPTPEELLSRQITAEAAQYRALSGAKVGVHVVRLADGKELAGVQADRPLLPASNQKVVTSAVALKRLGEDFRFRTVVEAVGDDLVITGDGDPTTGDPVLAAARGGSIYDEMDAWAAALKSAGLTQIKGDVIIRAGVFGPPRTHPDWPAGDLRKWYGAGVAGVNFNDNCIDVSLTVRGRGVQADVSPQSRWLNVINRIRAGTKHLWDCRFERSGTRITLTGTASRSSTEPYSVAAPDPPMLFAAVLADRLERGGIRHSGRVRISLQPAPAEAEKKARVITVQATPIAHVLNRANKTSLNMMAECLFLRSAAGSEPADWTRAAKTATQVLTGDYHLPAGQFRVADGSGLSRRNAVSPAAMTSLLRALAGSKLFLQSLPVAGVDGSLTRRLRGSARGRVLAKTGSMSGVSGLSGYVLDAQGRPAIAFSILVNGRTYAKRSSARNLEDSICRLFVKHLDSLKAPPAP